MWLLRIAHDAGQRGDATLDAIASEVAAHGVDVADARVDSLVASGHLSLVGGHLAITEAGLGVLSFEDATHGYERPGAWPNRR